MLQDAPDIICYPTDRAAWGRLTRLLTLGKSRAPKGECLLRFADVLAHAEGQVFIVVPPPVLDERFAAWLRGAEIYVAAVRRYAPDDAERLRTLHACGNGLNRGRMTCSITAPRRGNCRMCCAASAMAAPSKKPVTGWSRMASA